MRANGMECRLQQSNANNITRTVHSVSLHPDANIIIIIIMCVMKRLFLVEN